METPKAIVKKDTRNKLRCPHCGSTMCGRVVDSRAGKDISWSGVEEPTIYRRRRCCKCGVCFTSFEIVAQTNGITFTYSAMQRWIRLGRAVEGMVRTVRVVNLEELADFISSIGSGTSFLSLEQLQQMGFCAGIGVAKGSSVSVEKMIDKTKTEGA